MSLATAEYAPVSTVSAQLRSEIATIRNAFLAAGVSAHSFRTSTLDEFDWVIECTANGETVMVSGSDRRPGRTASIMTENPKLGHTVSASSLTAAAHQIAQLLN